MGRAAHAEKSHRPDPGLVRHPELMPLFATAIAIELAHLRWILLTQWTCRGCSEQHLHCGCRYGWLKRYL
jgi:hypothetical protein